MSYPSPERQRVLAVYTLGVLADRETQLWQCAKAICMLEGQVSTAVHDKMHIENIKLSFGCISLFQKSDRCSVSTLPDTSRHIKHQLSGGHCMVG